MIKVIADNKDITELINKVVVSGNESDIARSLELSYIYATTDYYTPKIYLNTGAEVLFFYNDIELFRGKVYQTTNNGTQGVITATCYDDSIKLAKSKGTFNFSSSTAEDITKLVLEEVGISLGSVSDTKIKQKQIFESENLYTIIKEVYDGASSQNGKKYINYMYAGKFYVIEVGESLNITLSDDKDITAINYQEDATNIINRVKIYDESGLYIDKTEDTTLINTFGIFQDIYTKEEDKQALAVAEEMIKGIDKTLSIEALGNYKCTSGYCIDILEKATGLTGTFLIKSDTHTFENGEYKMSLELEFVD